MSDLLFDGRNQNLHMDRANAEYMKTINITINTDLPSSVTPVLLYSYAHGYNYIPQFWGLWDVNYFPNVQPAYSAYKYRLRGYGYLTHNTGAGLAFDFYYVVDATDIKLYCLFLTGTTPKPTVTGTTATFTGYLFANDGSNQQYGA